MALGSPDQDRSGKFWINLHHTLKDSQGFLKKHQTASFIFFVAFLFAVFYLLRSQTKPEKSLSKNLQQTVVVAQAQSSDVPLFLNALGSVTPAETVTVKTQVNGQLIKVLFKEGQMVKKGELLAQIDSRPYAALLTQYQGQLARDQALLENAQLDLKRYEELWKQDSIAKQSLDTQRGLVKQYEGAVKSDEGLVQKAKVDLMYCNITAPISARVGLQLVDVGNFVQTSDTTGLFVLNQISPITVLFALPEDNIPQVLKKLNAKKKLQVQAYNRSQKTLLETGTLLTLDNQIDPTTGTVKLKAKFKNQNQMLFPNQFVNIRLHIDTLRNAITVPTSAVQYGTKNYVYVYKPEEQTVHLTPIEPGVSLGNNTVITSGLKKEEWIVIDGTDKLTDLAKVKIFDNEKANKIPLGEALNRGEI